MTVWIKVREDRYPMAPIGSLTLWDLMDMQRETGVTPQRLEECLLDIGSVGQKGARFASPEELLGSVDHLMALAIQIWAARRAAGERVSVREASDVPMDEWMIEDDGADAVAEQEPPDPTPADSGPAASAAAPTDS